MANTSRARRLTTQDRELIVADILSALSRQRRALMIRSARLAFKVAMAVLTIAVGLRTLGVL